MCDAIDVRLCLVAGCPSMTISLFAAVYGHSDGRRKPTALSTRMKHGLDRVSGSMKRHEAHMAQMLHFVAARGNNPMCAHGFSAMEFVKIFRNKESFSRFFISTPQIIGIQALCDMCRFALQNRPFHEAIWPVLRSKTGHIARRIGSHCQVTHDIVNFIYWHVPW